MNDRLRELEGGLVMNDGLREFGERCYKAGRMDVVEWMEKQLKHSTGFDSPKGANVWFGLKLDEWESQKKVWFNEKK